MDTTPSQVAATVSGSRPSDRWIPWYFVAFFVVLVLVLGNMAYLAVHSFPGLVTENAYEKGIAYNKILAAAQQEKSLGWHHDVVITPAKDSSVAIAFTLHDAQGVVLPGAQVTAWAVRPTQKGLDQKVTLQEDAAHHYTGLITLPVRGLWDVRISALYDGHNYQTTQRVELP